jgi:hypothetical protein
MLLCGCGRYPASQFEMSALTSEMRALRAGQARLEALLRKTQATLSADAGTARREKSSPETAHADAGRRTLSFDGTVRHGHRFEKALPGGLTFVLAPRRDGWDISLRQPRSSGKDSFGAVVVGPLAMNYGAGIVLTFPRVDLGDVRTYPPTQRFGRFAISEEQFAEARRLVEEHQANRRETRAWQEFMRLRERMGSYEIEFVKKAEADGSQADGSGGGALKFKVKLSVPENADTHKGALR